jgi:hypothetical protein
MVGGGPAGLQRVVAASVITHYPHGQHDKRFTKPTVDVLQSSSR